MWWIAHGCLGYESVSIRGSGTGADASDMGGVVMKWWGWIGLLLCLMAIPTITIKNKSGKSITWNGDRIVSLATLAYLLTCWMLWWAAWQ